MATLVGLQENFSNAMVALLELEYDALEAYYIAADKIENQQYKQTINEFVADHKRHVDEISNLLKEHNTQFKPGPDVKQWLTKGKVWLANLVGDKTILAAMFTNEIDTNSAYDRMLYREDMWEDAEDILARGLEDERKHKKWLAAQIKEKEYSSL